MKLVFKVAIGILIMVGAAIGYHYMHLDGFIMTIAGGVGLSMVGHSLFEENIKK